MMLSDDPCLDVLNRAYCYLRLSGMAPEIACRQLSRLLQAVPVGRSDAPSADRLMPLLERTLEDAGMAWPAPPSLPPIERIHIDYP